MSYNDVNKICFFEYSYHENAITSRRKGSLTDSIEMVTPTGVSWEETALYRFMKKHQLDQIDQLHRAIQEKPDWFWGEMEKEIGLTWMRPYSKVLDRSKGWAYSRWYVDGTLNIAYDAVDKHAQGDQGNRPAVIWVGDQGEQRRYSYVDLYKEVNRLANAFIRLGVKKGDRIVIYLPMIPEAAIALLSAAKIGAIAVPVFSGYGAEAIATRVNDCQAKVLITADGFFRRGKRIDMLNEVERVAELCSSLQHFLVVDRIGDQSQRSSTIRYLFYREVVDQESDDFSPLELSSEDPCLLLYTSGTTGRPKGTYHVQAGFPFKAAQDLRFAFDFGPEDRLFWVTDMGWMMGPWMIFGALLLGGSVLLFEGTPDYPKPDRLWQIVADHQVTYLGVSPTLVRSLMGEGTKWIEPYDLSSLKAFGSTGEPWNPKPWNWLFQQVGKGRCPILNYSGGTEISGGILGCFPGLPQKPTSFHGPIPGMVVDILDKEGKSVQHSVGELVIKQPWPGMTRGFWADQNHERYQKAYWHKYPDIWVHGDWARKDESGFWYIEGRSDDTLNIAGKRIGPAEYESALVAHPEVVEAATIGVPDPIKGTVAVCFVVSKADAHKREQLPKELEDWVMQKLGKPLKPKRIYCIQDLPRTRNGKIMRRVIRAVYLNENPGDLSSLENQHVLEEIRTLGSENDST